MRIRSRGDRGLVPSGARDSDAAIASCGWRWPVGLAGEGLQRAVAEQAGIFLVTCEARTVFANRLAMRLRGFRLHSCVRSWPRCLAGGHFGRLVEATGRIGLAARSLNSTSQPCREYVQTVIINNAAIHATVIVCKRLWGAWHVSTRPKPRTSGPAERGRAVTARSPRRIPDS